MNRPRRRPPTVMTGAEIIELVEKRAAIRAVVVESRRKVERRIDAVVILLLGAAAFRLFNWWALAGLVAYQAATGIKAYRNWKRISREQQQVET